MIAHAELNSPLQFQKASISCVPRQQQGLHVGGRYSLDSSWMRLEGGGHSLTGSDCFFPVFFFFYFIYLFFCTYTYTDSLNGCYNWRQNSTQMDNLNLFNITHSCCCCAKKKYRNNLFISKLNFKHNHFLFAIDCEILSEIYWSYNNF